MRADDSYQYQQISKTGARASPSLKSQAIQIFTIASCSCAFFITLQTVVTVTFLTCHIDHFLPVVLTSQNLVEWIHLGHILSYLHCSMQTLEVTVVKLEKKKFFIAHQVLDFDPTCLSQSHAGKDSKVVYPKLVSSYFDCLFRSPHSLSQH